MRLGATLPLEEAKRLGFTAAPVPDLDNLSDAELDALKQSFAAEEVLPVQLSAYCNLISTDEAHRQENIERLRARLLKADRVGCRAVVVGGGHRDPENPHEVFSVHVDTWRPEALELLAESCRAVLEGLELRSTKLVAETWVMTPLDSPRAVKTLVDQVNHPHFGILFDPVNLMSRERYADNGPFLRECLDTFGEAIALVHAKDSLMTAFPFTYAMTEVPLGEGHLDYRALLSGLAALPEGLPLVIEHLEEPAAFARAAEYLRAQAARLGLNFI